LALAIASLVEKYLRSGKTQFDPQTFKMSSDKCLGVLVIIFIGISASLAMPGLPCEEGVQIGHHFDCAWLWQCWEGDWWDLPCPEGQLFDTPTGFCVDFDEATCRPGTHPNEPPIDPPPSDGICPPNGIIFLPSEADCNEYFLCINGDKHPRNCRSDMHWNPEKDVCDYPYRAGCDVSLSIPK